jgi:hypothetical protein
MQNKTSPHVPFAQLPVEARFAFFFNALAAVARYRSLPPTVEELAPELEVAWNRNQLRQSDLSDPDRMTQLLEKYFSTTASNVTRRAVGQRSRRRGRKASR